MLSFQLSAPFYSKSLNMQPIYAAITLYNVHLFQKEKLNEDVFWMDSNVYIK